MNDLIMHINMQMNPTHALIQATKTRMLANESPKGRVKFIPIVCTAACLLMILIPVFSLKLKDKTVKAPVAYTIASNNNIKEFISELCVIEKTDLKSLAQNSPVVIQGKVKNVVYTSVEGNAWTKVDVIVEESYKGDLSKNDIISIYEYGGYIPLSVQIKEYHDELRFKDMSQEEINNTIVKSSVHNKPFPEVNNQNIYFLYKAPDDYPFPKGIYLRRGSVYGVLNLEHQSEASFEQNSIFQNETSPEQEVYTRENINDERESYTLEDIKQLF